MGIAERIIETIEKQGDSINSFANKNGIGQTTLNSIVKSKDPKPRIDILNKITKALNVPLDYIVNGVDNKIILPCAEENTLNIPFYGDVPVSAGGGTITSNEGITEYLPFNKSWVEQKIGISEGLSAFPVTGDSMYPTYRSGDTVICIETNGEYKGDGIYIVVLDDVVMIKRLNRTPQGIMKIISDNPLNSNYEINLKEEHLNFKVLAIVKMAVVLN